VSAGSAARLASTLAALLAALAAAPAAAQETRPGAASVETRPVVVRDVGPGEAGRVLRRALLAPHVVLRATERVVLPRDSAIGTTVVVLGGGDVAVGSDVAGDVIVVGGDLFMHPGGRVRGDAVAIGGGVYASTLATIDGRPRAFRDLTFDLEETPAGLALDYRSLIPDERFPLVTLPGLYGVRLPSFVGAAGPTYDRVNGVSLLVGPRINVDSGRVFVDPLVVYRSDLGAFDPRLAAGAAIGRRDSLSVAVERGTFTNDDWIRSDFWNSVITLASGKDTRNYFRADRAETRVHRRWEGAFGTLTAFVGGRAEDARSVGPTPIVDGDVVLPVTSGPWSIFGREDTEEGMLRANPPIDPGRTFSALAGAAIDWENAESLALEARLLVEQLLDAPDDFGALTQVTVEADLSFPTFRTQSFRFQLHGVFSGPDIAPRQRWAYLGGSGTLPTFDLLEFGGDELLFLESRYNVPIDALERPLFGTPVFTLRHMLGAAGPGSLPDFEQNLGVRLSLLLVLRLDYTIDPASGDSKFSGGVAFTPR
jgi:hypothetical protein